ncbi:hypothetical protein [Carboxylicivirga marina]|uniref:hypothetical protein n=1 Tax=Carboxylicivirga marina TaxID=2800988 RepID=UPI002594438F|nr:hypothetical protein [uncultured Carboxylicivirga sp.]
MKRLNIVGILFLIVVLASCKSIEISGSGHEEYPEFKDGYRDGDPDEVKYTTVEEWKKLEEEKKAAEEEQAIKEKKKK